MPASDLPRPMYATLRRTLDDRVLPEMRGRYAALELCVREAFVVKYEAAAAVAGGAPRQAGLGMHRDGTLLNCVVLLSDAADFEGGGTAFAPPLDRVYRPQRGDCLCSCGQLLHGAAPVTRGTRYVLIAFIDELVEAPADDE